MHNLQTYLIAAVFLTGCMRSNSVYNSSEHVTGYIGTKAIRAIHPSTNKIKAIKEDSFTDDYGHTFARYRISNNTLPKNTNIDLGIFNRGYAEEIEKKELQLITDENGIIHFKNSQEICSKEPHISVDSSPGAKTYLIFLYKSKNKPYATFCVITPNPIIQTGTDGSKVEFSKLEKNCNLVLLEGRGFTPNEKITIELQTGLNTIAYSQECDRKGRFDKIIDSHSTDGFKNSSIGTNVLKIVRGTDLLATQYNFTYNWNTNDWGLKDKNEYLKFRRFGHIPIFTDEDLEMICP